MANPEGQPIFIGKGIGEDQFTGVLRRTLKLGDPSPQKDIKDPMTTVLADTFHLSDAEITPHPSPNGHNPTGDYKTKV